MDEGSFARGLTVVLHRQPLTLFSHHWLTHSMDNSDCMEKQLQQALLSLVQPSVVEETRLMASTLCSPQDPQNTEKNMMASTQTDNCSL